MVEDPESDTGSVEHWWHYGPYEVSECSRQRTAEGVFDGDSAGSCYGAGEAIG